MKVEINKRVVVEKIKLVEKHLERLKEFKALTFGRLCLPINFDASAWNLRCALESTFDICAHILARIPGVKTDEYKQMAIEMGKQGFIPMDFAENNLYKMGGLPQPPHSFLF